jgi:Pin2-interacting protein X1
LTSYTDGLFRRLKLSHDPNNTAWTNDSQSFGLKMMTVQGWQPGNLLGAKDAPHAEFHTAANASHIRVMLKDDNLGLGAKIGSGVGHGECTGLDMFKNILGRLNGKDEDELVKEQKSRDDLRRAIYTERKWGSQRFVSGGFLIGDKIQDLIEGEAKRLRKLEDGSSEESSDVSSSSESKEEAPAPVEKSKKSKKRKAEAIEEAPEVVAVKVKKSKKKRKLEASPDETEEVVVDAKKSKKSKKDRKSEETDDTSEESKSRRRKEKKEKRRDKEHKKDRKEKHKSKSEETTKESKKKSKRDKSGLDSLPDTSESSRVTTKESTHTIPTTTPSSGRSTLMMQGRHAVRSRNIAQKRLAHMDVASLNQVSSPFCHFLCHDQLLMLCRFL